MDRQQNQLTGVYRIGKAEAPRVCGQVRYDGKTAMRGRRRDGCPQRMTDGWMVKFWWGQSRLSYRLKREIVDCWAQLLTVPASIKVYCAVQGK